MRIAEKWGADAIRDSDGTKLDDELKKSPFKIYNAYFPTRAHNDFITQHMEECPEMYLMSERVMATNEEVEIAFMREYYPEQLKVDYLHNPKEYWEVIDRTTGSVVSTEEWSLDSEKNSITIYKAKKWHEYTVSFLAYIIWDPVEMYNHLTNDWGDKEHEIPFDVLQPHSYQFVLETMANWLKENPDVDVVRFTTFFYQFSLVFNQYGKEKFVDWFGYGASVSPLMLEKFKEAKGYALRAEDFIDEGYYNSSFRIPTQNYLDYIDFVQQFVTKTVRKLTDMVHSSGKEAMMFLGDQWLGTEPYGNYFKETGLDAVVGSVGDGTTLRMISDIPHVKYTEGRFLPYFFPDTFFAGNEENIVNEARMNWVQARRAILRSPIERMGYGGYLTLADKFPAFIETVAEITEEFRQIHKEIKGSRAKTKLNVALLNHWGALRSWQAFTVAHALYCKEAYSYYGVLEALSGMDVEVSFISFEDVLTDGIDQTIDVIINAGAMNTAFSGGEIWKNERLISCLNEWIYNGGGFIGVGEPSGCEHQGRTFQMAHALGVDKEVGYSLSTDKYFKTAEKTHFITEGMMKFDFGEVVNSVYSLSENTEILEFSNDEVHISANEFGNGRTIYLAGLPFSFENARLLMRSLYFAARKEKEMLEGYSTNIFCEVSVFPEVKRYCVINNSATTQETTVTFGEQESERLTLNAYEIVWRDLL